MFGIFEPSDRRVKDEREIRYFYAKYAEDAPAILDERARDEGLSSRDRRHWRRLARKAGRHPDKWMAGMQTSLSSR